MKMQYLGTAAAEGIPGMFCACPLCSRVRTNGDEKDFRARSQAVINGNVIVDFGPDTYLSSVHHGVDLSKLEACLITHSHFDHYLPSEFEFRKTGFCYNTKTDGLQVYGNEKSQQIFSTTAFIPPVAANFQIVKKGEWFSCAELKVLPIPAEHEKTENAHIYLITDGEKTILYGTDTGIFTEEMYEMLAKAGRKIDLLSLDCTKGAREQAYYTHMSLSENARVRDRLAKAGLVTEKTVCVSTHFSHNCGMDYYELNEEAKKLGFIVAYDGMTVEV